MADSLQSLCFCDDQKSKMAARMGNIYRTLLGTVLKIYFFGTTGAFERKVVWSSIMFVVFIWNQRCLPLLFNYPLYPWSLVLYLEECWKSLNILFSETTNLFKSKMCIDDHKMINRLFINLENNTYLDKNQFQMFQK